MDLCGKSGATGNVSSRAPHQSFHRHKHECAWWSRATSEAQCLAHPRHIASLRPFCCREGARKTKTELDAATKAALDAFHLCPSLDVLVPALVKGGPGELQRRCSLTPGQDLPTHRLRSVNPKMICVPAWTF